ncbi:hypothetical protein KKE26_03825 [bacterium]|nr:hypothetical protein [bacterium]
MLTADTFSASRNFHAETRRTRRNQAVRDQLSAIAIPGKLIHARIAGL